jgi:hypothetical protein
MELKYDSSVWIGFKWLIIGSSNVIQGAVMAGTFLLSLVGMTLKCSGMTISLLRAAGCGGNSANQEQETL